MSKTKEDVRNAQTQTVPTIQNITLKDLTLERPLNPISPVAFATSLRVLMQNWRQGTVACKGRSDVARSNKKPWKQKGTGRARAGSARSPLWRGGGVIHGPQARTRMLAIPKEVRKRVLGSLLSQFLDKNGINSLDWQIASNAPSTKQAYTMLKNNGLENKKVVLFVAPHDQDVYASFINLPNVQMVYFDHPNAFDLAHAHNWLFLKNNFNEFKEMVSRWI